MEENKKYKVTIVIDGESAHNLFAVGPTDLKDFFLPEHLGVNPDDVRSIHMNEDLNEDELGDVLFGRRQSFQHKDNYHRDDDVSDGNND